MERRTFLLGLTLAPGVLASCVERAASPATLPPPQPVRRPTTQETNTKQATTKPEIYYPLGEDHPENGGYQHLLPAGSLEDDPGKSQIIIPDIAADNPRIRVFELVSLDGNEIILTGLVQSKTNQETISPWIYTLSKYETDLNLPHTLGVEWRQWNIVRVTWDNQPLDFKKLTVEDFSNFK
jgi:hypothetical protein